MATSDSFNFILNRQQIVQLALEEIGSIDLGGTVTDRLNTFCSRHLNMMLKNWAGQGLNLWRNKEVVLLLEPADTNSKVEYKLGGASSDSWMLVSEFNETFVNGDQVVDTTVGPYTVDDTSAMTVGDNVVIETEDNNSFVDTIATIPDSTTFTTTNAIDDDINDNSIVYFFTNKAERPLYFTDVWRRSRTLSDGSQGTDTPVHQRSRNTYYRLGDKQTESEVVEVYYDAQIGRTPDNSEGRLFVYPAPRDVGITLRARAMFPWEDMDDDTDNVAAPQEWLLTIVLGLALRLCNSQGVGTQRKREIKEDFNEALLNSWAVDHEWNTDGVQFQPDPEGMQNPTGPRY